MWMGGSQLCICGHYLGMHCAGVTCTAEACACWSFDAGPDATLSAIEARGAALDEVAQVGAPLCAYYGPECHGSSDVVGGLWLCGLHVHRAGSPEVRRRGVYEALPEGARVNGISLMPNGDLSVGYDLPRGRVRPITAGTAIEAPARRRPTPEAAARLVAIADEQRGVYTAERLDGAIAARAVAAWCQGEVDRR